MFSVEHENSALTLREEVIRLISLKQEGGYWDFKREWHEKKGALLHDIICMANNLHNRNAYIIIGVDEENEYRIVDVKDDPNRKTTQKVVDFFKDKKFAGGIRPLVHVEQIVLYSETIDIIVVENSHNTPFYLTEQFEGVRANHIYTRIMDTNTPIDKSADINYIEYLWRKRFHLDETPLEKASYYLKYPQNWANSPIEYDFCKFYKPAPEFIIRKDHDETRTDYEFYLFGQMDSRPRWYTITLYYYQTALEQFIGAALDGGRCFVVAPPISGVSFSEHFSWDVSYRYYEIDTLEYTVLQFFQFGGTSDYYAFNRFMKCVLMFSSETERSQFEAYVEHRENRYRELYAKQG